MPVASQKNTMGACREAPGTIRTRGVSCVGECSTPSKWTGTRVEKCTEMEPPIFVKKTNKTKIPVWCQGEVGAVNADCICLTTVSIQKEPEP